MIKQGVIVKAVVFDGQDRLLLVRRSKTAPRRPLEWDLPGGFVDDDDISYREACLRELREETGLEAAQDTIHLGYAESGISERPNAETYDITWIFFVMQPANTTVKLSYEHDKYTWVSMDEAASLITYDRQLRALAYLKHVRDLREGA